MAVRRFLVTVLLSLLLGVTGWPASRTARRLLVCGCT